MAFKLFGKKKDKKKSIYEDFKVDKIVNETHDSISIHFDKDHQPEYQSGQFLTLILTIDGEEVRRSYSLCSSPFADDHLAIAVKRVEGGVVSNYLPDNVKEGDTIKVMNPMGSFTLDPEKENSGAIVMFAGGSGITPMISIIKTLLSGEQNTKIVLIYANRDKQSIIFGEELNKLENDNENFKIYHSLDEAPESWEGHTGFITAEYVKDIFEKESIDLQDNNKYLLCGPQGMMSAVEGILEEKGATKDHIMKESFVQSTDKNEKETSTSEGVTGSAQLTIHYDGETYDFEVKEGEYILETALDNGYDIPFSCQSGLCTACRCKKISGEVLMDEDDGLSESELKDGYVLICVGKAGTEKVELEVG